MISVDSANKTVTITSDVAILPIEVYREIQDYLDNCRLGLVRSDPDCDYIASGVMYAYSPVHLVMQDGWTITNPEMIDFDRGVAEQTVGLEQ